MKSWIQFIKHKLKRLFMSKLEADEEDVKAILSELDGNGYYGWIRTKPIGKKTMTKIQIWHIKGDEKTLEHGATMITPTNTEEFKETYFIGGYSGSNESIITSLAGKVKDLNLASFMPTILNNISQQ